MGKILDLLKEEWEKARAPLEDEIEGIKKEAEELKTTCANTIRRKSAECQLIESEALTMESKGFFEKCDSKREEKERILAEIEALKKELIAKLQPLEERGTLLEDALKDLPRKILDGEFPRINKDALKTFEAGLMGLEEVLSSIQDFEKTTGAKFDDRYFKRLMLYDHKQFNDSKPVWNRLRRFIGTPISW